MGRRKINPLDKNRFTADSHLKEARLPLVKRALSRRNSNKRFNHPDIKRGSTLAKQARPIRSDYSFPRTPDEVLQELAEIRDVATRLKKNK